MVDLTDASFQVTCDNSAPAGYTSSTDTCGTAEMTTFFSQFDGVSYTGNFGLEVFLYDDSDTFTAFQTAVAADTSATTLYVSQSEDYSSYTMSWNCYLTTMISSQTDGQGGDGCCLRDMDEDTLGGGYCLIVDSNDVTNQITYRLSEENFASFTSDISFTWDSEMEET